MGDDQPPPPARVPGGTSRCDTGGGAATPPATPAVDTGLGAGPSLDGCAPTPAGQLAPHPAPTKPFDEGKADAAERGMPARLGSAGSAPLDLLPSAVSEMEVAPRPSVRERARRAASAAAYIWWGLPTACKATLLMAGACEGGGCAAWGAALRAGVAQRRFGRPLADASAGCSFAAQAARSQTLSAALPACPDHACLLQYSRQRRHVSGGVPLWRCRCLLCRNSPTPCLIPPCCSRQFHHVGGVCLGGGVAA